MKSRTSTIHVLFTKFGFVIAFIGLVLQSALAADVSWQNPFGGTFGNPQNWVDPQVWEEFGPFPNAAPGTSDRAIFSFPGHSLNIGFAANANTNSVVIGNGNINFNLGGNTYQLSNQIIVGNATLSLNHAGTLRGVNAEINHGNLNVIHESAAVILTESLYLGQGEGTGTLNIENGASVTNKMGAIGRVVTSTGIVMVTDADSTWNNNNLYIGFGGVGTLNIENGGRVTSTSGSLAFFDNAEGTATVTGAGSIWEISGVLAVGDRGTGTLNIENGGRVTNANGRIAYGGVSDAAATVTVSGAGSTWLNSGDLRIGDFFRSGSLSVENGGIVEVGGTLHASLQDLQGNSTIVSKGVVLGGADIVFNSTTGNQTTIGFGAGGQLHLIMDGSGDLGVGYYDNSSGTITISEGVKVASANGSVGAFPWNSQTSTATVTGVGSEWTIHDSLTVDIHGKLIIADGGQITNKGYSGSVRGTALITGAGSQWINEGTLYSDGTIHVENGGKLTSEGSILSGNRQGAEGIIVRGVHSTWVSGDLDVGGLINKGILRIVDGASVSSGNTRIGGRAQGDLIGGGDGAVEVRGLGISEPGGSIQKSTLHVAGSLKVGEWEGVNAELSITDGGAVIAEGRIQIGTNGSLNPDLYPDVAHVVQMNNRPSGPAGSIWSQMKSDQEIVIDLSGTLQGDGHIIAPTTFNHGRIEVGPYYLATPEDVNVRLSDRDSKSYEASFLIEGDFTQSATGTISIQELLPQHRLSPTGTHSTAMLVTGTATLAGKLEVGFADDYTPNIGDRFALITAKEIKGKIAKFENAVIDGVDDRFLGLNYRRKYDGSEPILELITLSAPTSLTGSPNSRNLVLVTHGTKDNADPGEWVRNLGNAIGNYANDDWHVVALDWKPYNGGGKDDEFYGTGGQPWRFDQLMNADPHMSASNGINIGESLVRWYAQQDQTFESVHLLGHSSGSWLVDSIADNLRRSEGMADRIHLTLFDAYTPDKGIWHPAGPEFLVIGDSADFADHYFHRNPVPLLDTLKIASISLLAGTNNALRISFEGKGIHFNDAVFDTDSILPDAVNVDLTTLAIRFGAGSHRYPIDWYSERAMALNGPVPLMFGPALSEEYRNIFPVHGEPIPKGSHFLLQSNDGINDTLSYIHVIASHVISGNPFEKALNLITGDVTILPEGKVLMRTQSPAILTSIIEIDEPFWAFEFDFTFLSEASGLLSVYFNAEQVFEFDSSLFGLGPDDTLNSGWIWLGEEYEPGPYSITFRLDPLGDEQASIQIDNLQFISLELIPIPEPTSVGAAILGLAFAAVVARRRKTSAESDTPQLAA